MSQGDEWALYFQRTVNQSPRKLLIRALSYVSERDSALDLGAGALNDSKFLLSEGFQHVVAEDKHPLAAEIAESLPPDRFTYQVVSMEEYMFPENAFNLVNAQYTLPFLNKVAFTNVWQGIMRSLRPNGIFVGQLFGDRDEWSTDTKMTFHTKAEALQLISKLEVISFEEEEVEKPSAAGTPKHWHVFHFILKRV